MHFIMLTVLFSLLWTKLLKESFYHSFKFISFSFQKLLKHWNIVFKLMNLHEMVNWIKSIAFKEKFIIWIFRVKWIFNLNNISFSFIVLIIVITFRRFTTRFNNGIASSSIWWTIFFLTCLVITTWWKIVFLLNLVKSLQNVSSKFDHFWQVSKFNFVFQKLVKEFIELILTL